MGVPMARMTPIEDGYKPIEGQADPSLSREEEQKEEKGRIPFSSIGAHQPIFIRVSCHLLSLAMMGEDRPSIAIIAILSFAFSFF